MVRSIEEARRLAFKAMKKRLLAKNPKYKISEPGKGFFDYPNVVTVSDDEGMFMQILDPENFMEKKIKFKVKPKRVGQTKGEMSPAVKKALAEGKAKAKKVESEQKAVAKKAVKKIKFKVKSKN